MSIENLPATLDGLSVQEEMRATGQIMSGNDGLGLPSLRVNYDDEDQDGNKIPRGSWTVYGEDGQVFADSVLFRPILTTIQYNHYDSDEGKTRATSIHGSGFDSEFQDSAGGFKCGKLSKQQFKELTEAEQAIQKDIKCSKVFFGLVTVAGVNTKGKKSKVADLPCVFYARGTHFMPMADYVEKLHRTNTPMRSVQISMDLNRQKNGGVTYWEVNPTTKQDGLELSAAINGVYGEFLATIKAENESIMSKWTTAQKKKGDASMEKISASATSGDKIMEGQSDDLTIDLDDEIPF